MLHRLCTQETLVINYNPSHKPVDVKNLNDELDFQHRLSEFYLTDPKTPAQIHYIIKTIFEKIFTRPADRTVYLNNRQDVLLP